MSEQGHLSKKVELLAILRESIDIIQSLPEEEIEKRKTKLNTDNGTGYYISNNKVHMWIVKLDEEKNR